MDKIEIFSQAIERFKDHDKEDLLSIGITIGSNPITFKKLYTAYFTNKEKFENKPRIGAKIEAKFNRFEDEVLIKRSKIELRFSTKQFLDYLNLLMICLGEIYPLGSVVEIDESLLRDEFKKAASVKTEMRSSVQVLITGRFVPLRDDNGEYLIEYVGRVRPFGEGSNVAPMLFNRVMIKSVVHSGLVDEIEEAEVMKLRSELIYGNQISVAFATDEQLEGLFGHLNLYKEGSG